MPIELRITGRSSSHFTRVTRIFAAELGVHVGLEVVRDLMSWDPNDYSGNPALKLPVLQASSGTWFGALNICRELSRLSTRSVRIVWPEDVRAPVAANAQELTLHAMATEVALIMARLSGADETSPHTSKMRKSLSNTMAWLESHTTEALDALPDDRDLSFLEVILYCLVTHLEFGKVLPTHSYMTLDRLCRRMGSRSSAFGTAYRFDT